LRAWVEVKFLRDLLRGGELLDLLVAADGSAEAVESERVSTA
jgi:hypothetical protein